MNRIGRIAAGLVVGGLLVAGIGYAVAARNGTNGSGGWLPPAFARAHGGRGFSETNGTVTGRFVAFAADPATGTIANLAQNGTTLVASLTLGASASERARGPTYALDGAAASMRVEDAPGARWQVAARNATTLALTLPPGANVTVHDAVADWSPAGATIDYGSLKENLVLSNGATLQANGSTLTLTLPAKSVATFGPAHPPGIDAQRPWGGPPRFPAGGPWGEAPRRR